MCALFGFLDYAGITPHKTLKKLVRALSIESEVRGTDATGFAYCLNGDIRIYKAALPARKVNFFLPPNTKVVTGHTRMQTKGDSSFLDNNHPFCRQSGIENWR
jgi:glucosamine--fructose-6-phosphate aminotransferase (isomerizing)